MKGIGGLFLGLMMLCAQLFKLSTEVHCVYLQLPPLIFGRILSVVEIAPVAEGLFGASPSCVLKISQKYPFPVREDRGLPPV